MIIPYIRSSLLGSYDICNHKMFIGYSLGIREPSNFSADSGTSVHKSLELLADKKKAIQDGKQFIENEIFSNPVNINTITEDSAFKMGWDFCKKTLPQHKEWDDTDTKLTYYSMYKDLLVYQKGRYNPLNLDIIQPEQFFDIEIKEDWARYSFLVNNSKLEGFLKIKGTMDLIFNNDGYLSGLDYKTSKSRKNWATGKIKNIEDLRKDTQLLLYSYAIKNVFKIDEFSIIIYFLRAGGPFEVYFDKKTYRIAEEMIKKYFIEIKKNKLPKMAIESSDYGDRMKCNWCGYNKINPKIHATKTVCETIRKELLTLGMDKVSNKYINAESFNYVGGGRGIETKGK